MWWWMVVVEVVLVCEPVGLVLASNSGQLFISV